MIEHLGRERGLSRADAYILCSLAGDLKICEVVDTPNWVVGCFMPDAVFESAAAHGLPPGHGGG
jgi:acetamidase/formamidase